MAHAILDDPDVRERYLGYLRIGMPKHKAARELGLSNTVVSRYVAKHADFAADVKDAVGEGVDPLYERAYDLALGRPCSCSGGHTEVEVGRQGNAGKAVQVHELMCGYLPPDPEMLKFMLKSLQPETFGSKVHVEVEHKVDLGDVSQLLELEERLRRRKQELGGGQAFISLSPGAVRELPAG